MNFIILQLAAYVAYIGISRGSEGAEKALNHPRIKIKD